MKNAELYNLRDGIAKCASLKGADFALDLVKNARIINTAIEDLEKVKKKTEAYDEYEKEISQLLETWSKDENGISQKKPMGNNMVQYDIPDSKKAEYEKELKKLEKKNDKLIKEQEAKDKLWEELLPKEAEDLKLKRIKTTKMPKDISFEQMYGIEQLID